MRYTNLNALHMSHEEILPAKINLPLFFINFYLSVGLHFFFNCLWGNFSSKECPLGLVMISFDGSCRVA